MNYGRVTFFPNLGVHSNFVRRKKNFKWFFLSAKSTVLWKFQNAIAAHLMI
jgi:hypothetical protein